MSAFWYLAEAAGCSQYCSAKIFPFSNIRIQLLCLSSASFNASSSSAGSQPVSFGLLASKSVSFVGKYTSLAAFEGAHMKRNIGNAVIVASIFFISNSPLVSRLAYYK